MRRTWIAIFSLLMLAAAPACKKSPAKDTAPPVDNPPATGSRIQLSLDSLFLYARETYLWYDVLPDYNTFNPRSYEGPDELTSLRNELFKISQYKIDDKTGKPYEYTGRNSPKYSFVEKGNAAQGIQGVVDLEGKGNDMGFAVFLISNGKVYVRLVEKGSSADAQGLTRGCEITKLNGSAVLSETAINTALNANSASITFRKPGSLLEQTVTVTKGTYTNDPVYTWKVFTNGSKITGYINLARFSRLANAKPSMEGAFSEFASKGVNNLVIDLRYNGGGYVETFEHLANLIAPADKTGQVMYKETFNKLLQEGKAPILKSIPLMGSDGLQQKFPDGTPKTYANVDFSTAKNTRYFKKAGTLGAITKVVFIVSGSSASASELTINSLRPHMSIALIGDTTYGKPVGFFGIGIDKYTVYMSQFTTVNSQDKGDYYAGIAPDHLAADDYMHDFGDPQEVCLGKALALINTGAVSANPQANFRLGAAEAQPLSIGGAGFNGMVEDRRVLK
jgi:C-terminal processing protease CtpA/Prc